MRPAPAIAVVLAMLAPSAGGAQEQCVGTKQWYQGKCRYPDDIERMKQDAARKRDTPAPPPKADPPADDTELRKEEAQRAAEAGACRMARAIDTRAGWKSYLAEFPDGACRDEAEARVAKLAEEPPPAPPAPPATAEPGFFERVPTLAWVGFGIGAGGLLLGTITGAVSIGQAKDIATECPNDQCPAALEGDIDGMLALAHVSTVSFVLAAAGISVGVIAVATSGGPGEGRARLELAPLGLRARASF
jgi:hypothetical protein